MTLSEALQPIIFPSPVSASYRRAREGIHDMHGIKAIRDNPAGFDAGLARRGLAPLSAEILKIDAERRDHVQKLQDAQARRNAASKEIGEARPAPPN